MVALDTVQAANAVLVRNRDQPLVAVFAGATSGIGLYTLECLVKTEAEAYAAGQSKGIRIYIIGRNEVKVQQIISRCKSVSAHGTLTFVQAKDLGSIKDIDAACKVVEKTEKENCAKEGQAPHVDLLVCTQGGIYWKREEIAPGQLIDLTLHYYSRARMIMNLEALLNAGKQAGHVITVYAAGMETVLERNDLGLSKTPWGFDKARSHCTYMMTALMERMAQRNPKKLALVNAYPGLVVHEGFNSPDHPAWFRVVWRIAGRLVSICFSFSGEEAGQRTLFLASNEYFPPSGESGSTLATLSTTGVKGAGAYAVGHKGDATNTKKRSKAFAGIDSAAFQQEVWDHTLSVCEEAKGR